MASQTPRAMDIQGAGDVELLCTPVGHVDPWPGWLEVRKTRTGWSDHKKRGKASSETRLVKPPGAETSKDQRMDLVPLYESKCRRK